MQAELNSLISRRISQAEDASESRRDVRFLSTWSCAPVGSLVEFRSPAARDQNQSLQFQIRGMRMEGNECVPPGSRLNGSTPLPNAGRERSTVATLSQILRQRRYPCQCGRDGDSTSIARRTRGCGSKLRSGVVV